MWQRMKRMGKGTITFRTNWEAHYVLKMKADLPEKPMDTELLERICMGTRESCKCLAIQATRETM